MPQARQQLTSQQQPSKRSKRKSKKRAALAVANPTQLVAQSRGRAYANVQAQMSKISASQGMLLAKQMALPESCVNLVRLPTADMPRTAVMKTIRTTAITQAVSPSIPLGFPCAATDLFFVAFGQPGRSYMYGPVVNTAAVDAITCNFKFAKADGSTSDRVSLLNSVDVFPAGTTKLIAWDPVAATDALNGLARPIGYGQTRKFVWVDASEKFLFNVWRQGTNVATPDALQVLLYLWAGPGETDTLYKVLSYAKGDAASKTFAFTPTISGYYAIDITISTLDTDLHSVETFELQVQLAATVANPTRMVTMWNETLGSAETGECCRRTAYTLLISNTSAVINQQGTVVAGRMINERMPPPPGSVAGPTLNRGINATALSELSNKYTGKAEKGLFTYMDFDDHAAEFTQAVNDYAHPVFDLNFSEFVHVALFNNPNTATQVNSFLVTSTMAVEFKTDSMLFPVGVPVHEFDALVEARRINNSTDYFYENPLHMGDIWKYIKSGFNAFRRIAIPLGAAASTFAPEAAGVIMPIAHALQM